MSQKTESDWPTAIVVIVLILSLSSCGAYMGHLKHKEFMAQVEVMERPQ